MNLIGIGVGFGVGFLVRSFLAKAIATQLAAKLGNLYAKVYGQIWSYLSKKSLGVIGEGVDLSWPYNVIFDQTIPLWGWWTQEYKDSLNA